MTYLAGLIVIALIAYVCADLMRRRALRRNVLSLSDAFGTELAALRETSRGIDALRRQVETQLLNKGKSYGGGSFPDISATVFERPYTRLSLESGTQRLVAAFDCRGRLSIIERFESPEILLAEDFPTKLPKAVALALITSIIQDYNRLAVSPEVASKARLRA